MFPWQYQSGKKTSAFPKETHFLAFFQVSDQQGPRGRGSSPQREDEAHLGRREGH